MKDAGARRISDIFGFAEEHQDFVLALLVKAKTLADEDEVLFRLNRIHCKWGDKGLRDAANDWRKNVAARDRSAQILLLELGRKILRAFNRRDELRAMTKRSSAEDQELEKLEKYCSRYGDPRPPHTDQGTT